MAAQHFQFAAVDLVLIFEQSTRRWARGMRSVLIESAPMAWTHEQSRFLKPTNRAAEVGAVDRENLELFGIDSTHPARPFGSVSVPGLGYRIAIDSQSSLAFREAIQRTERNPTVPRTLRETRQDVAQNGHADKRSCNAVQARSDLEKEIAARHTRGRWILGGGQFLGPAI